MFRFLHKLLRRRNALAEAGRRTWAMPSCRRSARPTCSSSPRCGVKDSTPLPSLKRNSSPKSSGRLATSVSAKSLSPSSKDLTAVGRLQELESLRLDYGIYRLGDRFVPVDFSGLRKLRRADVMMCHPFESILACKTIKNLVVCNDCDRRLRDLDLSLLPKLRELRNRPGITSRFHDLLGIAR